MKNKTVFTFSRLITQDNNGKRMVTAEDYLKWYDFYLILEDGTVEVVEWKGNDALQDGWRDHCIVPEKFKEMAEYLGAVYDEETWKAVCDMYEENMGSW